MAYARKIANADGAGCASFLSFGPTRYTSLGGDVVTKFSFNRADVAGVVEPAKVRVLLAAACADGSFFSLPEDYQLAAAAFYVVSEDDDRSMVSAEEADKLLERWKQDNGRA